MATNPFKKKEPSNTLQNAIDSTKQSVDNTPRNNPQDVANYNKSLDVQVTPTGNKVSGNKEYNVQQGGKTYPTTNPDFVPNPNQEQIHFNADNTVTVSPAGSNQSITLSKSEYKTAELGQSGAVTNKVQELQAVKQQAKQIQPVVPQTTEQTFNQQAQQVGGFDLTTKPMVARALTAVVQGTEAVTGIIGGVLGFDISTPKSTEVRKAEQAFSDTSSVINQQIDDYKKGRGSKAEIQRSLELSQSAILDLYRQTKGLGQTSPRFWLDQGAEIEAQLQRELAVLESQRRTLNSLP